MKKTFLFACLTLLASSAFATDGRSAGCFDLNLQIPKDLGTSGATALVATSVTVCTTEKNMKFVDSDQIDATGDFNTQIKNNGHVIANFNTTARASEGAAGTIITSYSNDLKTIDDENGQGVITFSMRNDHLRKGQIAGSLKINGQPVGVLIQK